MGMTPHNSPTFNFMEKAASARVIASGWIAQNKEVEAFENELCEFFDLPKGHAIAVSSGSAALYLSLWVLDGHNKRIGLPVYACSALRNAIGLLNGRTVYFDCGADSPNINVSIVNDADVDILIAPSMFGIPVDLSTKKKFRIIEDIAQSFGAISFGKRIGLRGDVGVCSFYATKMITSGGQGGAVISRDKTLIDKLKDYREFDSRNDTQLRFNFQMTDLHAAIGRVQLKKLPSFIERREQIFSIYASAGLNLLNNDSKDSISVPYRAIVRCDNQKKLIQTLAEENFQAIVPIKDWELLDDFKKYPIAYKLAHQAVSLPIYPSLLKSDAKKIANIAKSFR